MIFPNPAKDYLELNFKDLKNNYQFELSDIQGKALQSKVITENINKININNYFKGIFFC